MIHALHVRDRLAWCPCGRWSCTDSSWPSWYDGTHIRLEAWDSFESHVRRNNPDVVKVWRLHGWYPTVAPRDRNARTISDGAVFSSVRNAIAHVKATGFLVGGLEPCLMGRDSPIIDYVLQPTEERFRRLLAMA